MLRVCIVLLLTSLTTCSLLAQRDKVVLTSPQQPIVHPCKMANGTDMRPFGCEFRFDKLEIYGKSGNLLATVDSQHPTVSLLSNQASAMPSGSLITFAAKAYLTRINPPTFPVKKGYWIQRSNGPMAASNDEVVTLLLGTAIDKTVGVHKVVGFALSWPHNSDGTALFGLHIVNDVTRNYFTPKPGTTLAMRDIAEATLLVNPRLVGRNPVPGKGN